MGKKDFCVYIYLNAYFQFLVHNNSYIYEALISGFVTGGDKGWSNLFQDKIILVNMYSAFDSFPL